MTDILPESRPKIVKGIVYHNGQTWQPIFCANCGADGGYVPEQNMKGVFWLCQKCAEKWSPLAGTMKLSCEEFWEKVNKDKNKGE